MIFEINAYMIDYEAVSCLHIHYFYLLAWFLATKAELNHSGVHTSNTIVIAGTIHACANMEWVTVSKQHKQTKTGWWQVEPKPKKGP